MGGSVRKSSVGIRYSANWLRHGLPSHDVNEFAAAYGTLEQWSIAAQRVVCISVCINVVGWSIARSIYTYIYIYIYEIEFYRPAKDGPYKWSKNSESNECLIFENIYV